MGKTLLDELQIAEQASAPGSPPSGYQYIYPKTDGKFYAKNSAGVETEMTNAAGGGQTENFNWKFDTATAAADPGSGYFRLNNATPASVTQIYVDDLCDVTGFDISNLLNSLSGSYSIYIQQTNDATKFIQFDCTAPFTDNTGWFTIPVTFVQVGAGGLFTNNTKCTWYIINKNTGIDTNFANTNLTLTGNRNHNAATYEFNFLHTGSVNNYASTWNYKGDTFDVHRQYQAGNNARLYATAASINANNRAYIRSVTGAGTSGFEAKGDATALIDGTCSLLDYGIGAITGTPAYGLAVDAVGKVIEVALVTDTNFGNTDLLFTGNRIHDIATYEFVMIHTGSINYPNSTWEYKGHTFQVDRQYQATNKSSLVVTANVLNTLTKAYLEVTDGAGTSGVYCIGNATIELDGTAKLLDYGTGTITGTATYYLGVDSTGKIIEEPIPSGTPGGTTNEVQYNNAGTFGGAANVEIEGGNLKLVSTTDPSAPTGGLLLYSKSIANKHLPKIIGPSGIDTILQSSFSGNSIVMIAPASGTTAPNIFGGTLTTAATMSLQFTAGSTNRWSATARKRFQTSTTAGNASGMRTAYVQWFRGNAAGYGGFWFRAQLGAQLNLNGGQKFVGLCASTSVLGGDPSALVNMCGMGYDAGDSSAGNWFFMRNDGAGTATKVDLGVNAARGTTQGWDLIMFLAPNGTELFVRITNLNTDVVVLDTSYTTDLPAVNTGMAFKAEVRNGAVAAADNLEVAKVYIESDY